MSSVIVSDLRNVDRLHFLITRRSHFQGSRQVAPQLEAMHSPGWIPLRHLMVDDTAACSHPLHSARSDGSAVAHAVPVFNRSSQHVLNGFNSAMRMPGKSCKVII